MKTLFFATLLAAWPSEGPYLGQECLGPGGGPIGGYLCLDDDIRLGFGTGATAACGDEPYHIVYDSAGTAMEIWSLDCDGVSTACAWVQIVDGTDDPIFSGMVTAESIFSNGDVVADASGSNTNSPSLSLRGDNATNEVEGSLFLAYGAQPYLVVSVDDDGTTPSLTQVLHIDDNSLRPASGGLISAGSATAYFSDVLSAELSCMDTDHSNQLSISWNENDSADRTLTFAVNSGNRAVSLSGDLTVESASTVNQDLTTDANSQFGSVTVNNTGLHVLDTNASHDLIIAPGSDLTADKTLTVTTGDADRTVTLSSNLTVEAASTVNQDLTTDAAVEFASAVLNTGPLSITSDTYGWCAGSSGCSDSSGLFDGTDFQLSCPGCSNGFYFNASIIVGTIELPENGGLITVIDEQVTASSADGNTHGTCIAVDSSSDATFCVQADSDGAGGVDTFDITVPSYDVDYVFIAGKTTLGPTAPTFTCNDNCCGATFNADNESVEIDIEIPSCYVDSDSSDVTLKIYWCTGAQDPAQNETIKMDIAYDVLTWGTDDIDGATTAGTVTYTEAANPGDQDDSHISTITLDADDGTNPIDAGESLTIKFDRDVTADTYGGDLIVERWELTVPQDSLLCDHHN